MEMAQAARTGDRDAQSSKSSGLARGRAPLHLAAAFGAVALLLIGVFDAAEWYAGQVSLPRYCDRPDASIALVRETLSERRPASEASTRPYVIAAKLIYLIPRNDGEPLESYLARLRLTIAESCG